MGKKNKGKKSKPLTGLAAALVKSGHLSEKKAKVIARDQRREDKQLGRHGLAKREEEQQQVADGERLAQAVGDREREEARQVTKADEAALRAIRDGLNPNSAGGRRWFFAARDGRILYLDLADQVTRELMDGLSGIVESQGVAPREHVVVNKRAVETLTGLDKELVRFFNLSAAV